MVEGKPVIDVDGSYLYRKQQKQATAVTVTNVPSEPLAGWESVTADNCEEMKVTVVVFRVTIYLPGRRYW